MGNGSSTAGIIIGSVLISIIAVAGITYFALPYFYSYLPIPNQNTNQNKNTVLQTIYQEYTTSDQINDTNINYTLMSNIGNSITINVSSRIYVTFESPSILTLDPTYTGGFVMFAIALNVEGVGNNTSFVAYYDSGTATGNTQQISQDITINYMTSALSAGTYNIDLYWKSVQDVTGNNYLKLYSNYVNVTQSLMIQEIV